MKKCCDTGKLRRPDQIKDEQNQIHRKRFAQCHKDIHNRLKHRHFIDSHQLRTKEILDYVASEFCEIGVLLKNRENRVLDWEMEQQELDFHLLATMRPKVYVPKQHPLAGRTKVSMEDLAPYVYSHYFQGIDSSRDRFFSEELVENTVAKKTITLTDEMADASIGMEMNTYTIGSGMSGENLLEKDYAVMNLDTHQRIELGWISRRDHELSNFGKRFLDLLAEKLNSMQLD